MNIYFNTHFDKILSLGSNCYPKFFISKILKPSYGETELFDYIGSSMWSINMLILNDFKDIHNDTYFKLKPVLENDDPIVTNIKYNLRFKHDLKTVSDCNTVDFQNKLQRRIGRFKKNLKSGKVLFIRHQESQTRRIPFSVQRSEIDELEEFIDILDIKYKCSNVKILYINLDTDGWNERQNIFSVKINSLDYDWANAHKIIATLFEEKQVCNKLMDLAPST